MARRAVGCIIAILMICLTGCGSAQSSATPAPDPIVDGKISIESAEAIALEKANSMAAELSAENIQLDENEPCELMTLKDTTVWAVKFTYTIQGQTDSPVVYGMLVMVDVYSGEIFRVYFS